MQRVLTVSSVELCKKYNNINSNEVVGKYLDSLPGTEVDGKKIQAIQYFQIVPTGGGSRWVYVLVRLAD